jgi:5-methylcytosine-specific restriction endonuclease McrA
MRGGLLYPRKETMAKTCQYTECTRGCYGSFCIIHKPRKPLPAPTRRIKQQSAKEKQYQVYKESEMRPAVIARDGNNCYCCTRPAYPGEKLDLEHTLTKGSRPDLKRDIANIKLYCRPCHNNKTDHRPCPH